MTCYDDCYEGFFKDDIKINTTSRRDIRTWHQVVTSRHDMTSRHNQLILYQYSSSDAMLNLNKNSTMKKSESKPDQVRFPCLLSYIWGGVLIAKRGVLIARERGIDSKKEGVYSRFQRKKCCRLLLFID
jgi:hypothetical protein